MLPGDIRTCLELSDICAVVKARQIFEPMRRFILDLMLADKLWGCVVDKDSTNEPMCFGSCIFISDDIASELRAGKHPFLLTELCQSRALQTHILSLSEVKKESKRKNLNFYGALFSFARTHNPASFIAAMNQLQRGLVETMAGFGLKQYFKQTYEGGWASRTFKNFAMRMKFGAELVTAYAGDTSDEVKTHRPYLFAATKEEAVNKLGMPICELMWPGDAVLDLPPSVRMILRLEIDGCSGNQMQEALLIGQGTDDSNWATAIRKVRSDSLKKNAIGFDENACIRACVRKYVQAHPQELGVLPLLAEGEKNEWRPQNSVAGGACAAIKGAMGLLSTSAQQ